jgi:SAM-dependent methyltransferase
MFAPLLAALDGLAAPLAATLGVTPAAATALALAGLHLIDACDTAAVRDGLLDDALLDQLAEVNAQLARALTAPAPPGAPRPDLAGWQAALARLAPPPSRAALASRLTALRAGRQRAGEPASAVVAAIEALPDPVAAALAPALATCQLWYCEAATAGLSPAAQVALLAAVVGAARRAGLDLTAPWHAQLQPLVGRLHGDAPTVRYRLRLLEAATAATPLAALLGLDDQAAPLAPLGPLGTLTTRLGGGDAIVVDYQDSDESAALITLLALYETRSQVAFHTTLKALCDLYGLRKDEFDRVANEANYLATMNAARSDKERMVDLVRPGRILEVGPGGGVVLDLLEQRFPDSEVIGLDMSREVIGALEARARAGGKRWRVLHGAAEDLPRLFPAPTLDAVIFCSVLHEVYSYTPFVGDGGGPPRRFQLDAVRDVIRAAWAVLRPGGRIVIRDGVRPPEGTRRIRLLAADARPTFDLYVAQFEGRPIPFATLSDGRIELSTADAMEFLYTYTWGPASFPYEVRELYGLMTYEAYVAQLIAWLGGPEACAVVELPAPLRSYLQPGYVTNLAGKVELTDARDQPVALPDSNCLIVVERRG